MSTIGTFVFLSGILEHPNTHREAKTTIFQALLDRFGSYGNGTAMMVFEPAESNIPRVGDAPWVRVSYDGRHADQCDAERWAWVRTFLEGAIEVAEATGCDLYYTTDHVELHIITDLARGLVDGEVTPLGRAELAAFDAEER